MTRNREIANGTLLRALHQMDTLKMDRIKSEISAITTENGSRVRRGGGHQATLVRLPLRSGSVGTACRHPAAARAPRPPPRPGLGRRPWPGRRPLRRPAQTKRRRGASNDHAGRRRAGRAGHRAREHRGAALADLALAGVGVQIAAAGSSAEHKEHAEETQSRATQPKVVPPPADLLALAQEQAPLKPQGFLSWYRSSNFILPSSVVWLSAVLPRRKESL